MDAGYYAWEYNATRDAGNADLDEYPCQQTMNGVRNAHSNPQMTQQGMSGGMQPGHKLANSQSAQIEYDYNNKKKRFSQEHFDSLKNTQEKCQYLGGIFWPYVAVREPEMKRKITRFMIWKINHQELIDAIFNDQKLEEIFEKSKKTVQNTIK
eukprot:Mrub_07793.p1 GENE.Mrub_07793~~Mrub_07793.p1  ORF type:complete len:153 (+),score=28.46 Mrub_07793:365-823(+)